MNCNQCGTELSKDTRFCIKCGNPVNSETAGIGNPAGTFQAQAQTTEQASPRPYRWGQFQGWFLVVGGGLIASVVALMISAPQSGVVRAFAKGFFGDNAPIIVDWESGNSAGLVGSTCGLLLLTIGSGVGILKKRTFGMILLLLLIVRAVFSANLLGLAFLGGSLPYYFKRRREFHTP